MPRMRTLKPSFFFDSALARLPPLHRIAFQGLWCQADRDGRIEDKPDELRAQILPFDACDFEGILADLAKPKDEEPGFIQRYRVGSKRIIAITTFADHQKPHIKEADSTLPPPPPWKNPAQPVPAPEKPGEPELGSGEPGGNGSLVLGSGSLVLGVQATPPPDPIAAMGAVRVPAVALGALPDRREPDSPGAPLRAGATVEAPTTPPDSWLGPDFWAWAQSIRQQGGLLAERPPHHRKLSGWWSDCLMREGVTVRALKDGFYEFGQSKFWESTAPPYPFHAFMSQWDQFTRPGVSDGAAA